MRSLMMLAAFLAASTSTAGDSDSVALATVPRTVLVPLQLADGSQQWRLVHKQASEEVLADAIAQGLASAKWCPLGWEETKRSTPSRGLVMIEGRCK